MASRDVEEIAGDRITGDGTSQGRNQALSLLDGGPEVACSWDKISMVQGIGLDTDPDQRPN